MIRSSTEFVADRRWLFVLMASILLALSACSRGRDKANPLHIDVSSEEVSSSDSADVSPLAEPVPQLDVGAPEHPLQIRRADGAALALTSKPPIVAPPIVVPRAEELTIAEPLATESSSSEAPPPAAEDHPDYDRDCSSAGCHDDFQKSAFVHAPVLSGECEACHKAAGAEAGADDASGDDTAIHEFQLSIEVTKLCTQCHSQAAAETYGHEPYAELDCLACHDPHGGATRHLMRSGSEAELCGKCHGRREHEILHGPVAAGECTVCHAPHQSSHEHLLRRNKNELCISCHTRVGEVVASLPHLHGPVTVDCGACHEPHGATNKRLLRQEGKELCLGCHASFRETLASDSHTHGALETEAACMSCHTAHASALPSQLRAPPGELCINCHNREIFDAEGRPVVSNIAAQIESAKFKHGPVRTGDCEGCHRPHTSSHPNLLQEEYPAGFYADFAIERYALCFQCHEKDLVLVSQTRTLTKFRDGDFNLHYVHVNRPEKGRTCGACHEPHGSNQPHHVRESVPFGKMNWKLPLNFENTATGGSCQPGCHDPAGYDRERPVGGAK